MFYTLLKDYKIGGNFLKILQQMYSENQIFVKLSDGLCQPFVSSVGVLQGETNSPLLFNLFVNKISQVFDSSCDPVQINNTDQSCLLWSDDLFVVSQSAEGLQNSINNVVEFYDSLGLKLNSKKTKIVIFNKTGKVFKGYSFSLAENKLEVTDCYQYLGVKLRPSGSFTVASEELCSKARKAWFSISKIIYKDKRIPVERAFQLFDSLVTPVALYGCEIWYPCNLPKKGLQDRYKLMACWESLKCETLNQYCSRILLSVHRKASRLAVLGDLGRFPMAIRAMAHTLNYRLCLTNKPATSLIGNAITEMKAMSLNGTDCWINRTDKMSKLLGIPDFRYNESSGRKILKHVQSNFERFWLDEIKSSRVDKDGVEHNKLHTYSSFKCHFGIEPYVSLVRNRNQRCHLSRLRVSAHRLGCEVLRYQRPPIPRDQRYCVYCPPEARPGGQSVRPVDNEQHCLTECKIGQEDRPDLYACITSSNASFDSMCSEDKFKTLVCPTNSTNCKLVSRFLYKLFRDRDDINCGV